MWLRSSWPFIQYGLDTGEAGSKWPRERITSNHALRGSHVSRDRGAPAVTATKLQGAQGARDTKL